MQILLYQLVPVPLSWGRITEDDSGLPMDGMAVLAVLCVLSPENYTTFFLLSSCSVSLARRVFLRRQNEKRTGEH